jgi:uncharacterized protein YqeY
MPRQREYIGVLEKAIELQKERAQTYRVNGRDGLTVHAEILKHLWPEGLDFDEITAEKFVVLNYIIGKVVRYGLKLKDGGHEDSAMDICVYGAILAALDPDPELAK